MTFEEQRHRMVEQQLRARDITDARVLATCARVPRHAFVPESLQHQAYADQPLPIGAGQTISQPYMVALLAQILGLRGHERVLEIGTGSGYQLAVLAELALEVYSIERIPELAARAMARLQQLGSLNVHLAVGDGTQGWAEHAPFDAIVVTAAAVRVPLSLLRQLADGGRLVMPVGDPQGQVLTLFRKDGSTVRREPIAQCVFVPLVAESEDAADGPSQD